MGCFKAILDKLKKDIQQKMGNMPTLKINEEKFERMSDDRSSKKSVGDFMCPEWMDPHVPVRYVQGRLTVIKDIDEIEQMSRNRKSPAKSRFDSYQAFPKEAFTHGRHITQKYYHGPLGRLEAEQLLKASSVNGTWLLRESQTRPGFFAISTIYNERVYHKYVSAALYFDESTGKRIYVATLDKRIAFYDLHSLTEFYRLNDCEDMFCKLKSSLKKKSQKDSSPSRMLPKESRPTSLSTGKKSKDSPTRSPQSPTSKSPLSLKSLFSKTGHKSKKTSKPTKLALAEDLESPQGVSSSGISSTGTPDSPPLQEEVPELSDSPKQES